jgi:hypothetical protein
MRAPFILLAAWLGLVPMLLPQRLAPTKITLKATVPGELLVSRPAWIDAAMCDERGNVTLDRLKKRLRVESNISGHQFKR